MRHGGWQDSVGIQLWRRTLGLVGLGKQGSLMVPVAKAFDMDVIAWSQNLTEEAASAVGARRVEKDELFRRSDIVSIHVVLGERTRGLVGAPELALMKQGALLVNTARGPIVDEGALLEALDQGRRRAPNAILTPHLGYTVEEFFEVAYQDTVENLIAFHEGAPLRLVTAENNFSSPPR
jgi:D-3-phosphoglycerate dehydrogenase